MRNFILFFLLFLTNLIFAQENKSVTYYPNGESFTPEGNTIGEINKSFEEYGRVYTISHFSKQGDSYTTIVFKLFTDKPLWILTQNPSKIKEGIESFNLNEFLHSWEFEFELENFIEEGVLTDIFILETLGKPSNKSRYFDKDIAIDRWTYNDLGVTLNLKNGIVYSYIKIE